MRGTFTPEAIAARDTEWCERRRLARIHRYTRDRKRAEFQPVPAAAFMRFLFDWPGLVGRDKREGPEAPELVLAQLDSFPVALTSVVSGTSVADRVDLGCRRNLKKKKHTD